MRYSGIAFLLLLVNFLSAQEPVKSEFANGIKYQVLFDKSMREGVSCYRIPTLVTALNGDLIAAMDERVTSCGDLKLNNNINIVTRRSKDNGKTWSPIETIVDYPIGQSASDPSMIVDQFTADIFLFYNYMDLQNEKDVYYFKMIKSSDNGKTWSSPIDITDQVTKPEWHNDAMFMTSGRGSQTKSGKLLHTIVNLKRGVYVFGSEDHGKTWFFKETPVKPADESFILELSNGNWMINSRVRKAGVRYVHVSNDDGLTWFSKPDSTLLDPTCNASFIRYSSKKHIKAKKVLLFSNANSKTERKNMTVRTSLDEGKTWSKGLTIYTNGAAYSSLTILKNGDVGLLFEKDNYSENVFVLIPYKLLIKN